MLSMPRAVGALFVLVLMSCALSDGVEVTECGKVMGSAELEGTPSVDGDLRGAMTLLEELRLLRPHDLPTLAAEQLAAVVAACRQVVQHVRAPSSVYEQAVSVLYAVLEQVIEAQPCGSTSSSQAADALAAQMMALEDCGDERITTLAARSRAWMQSVKAPATRPRAPAREQAAVEAAGAELDGSTSQRHGRGAQADAMVEELRALGRMASCRPAERRDTTQLTAPPALSSRHQSATETHRCLGLDIAEDDPDPEVRVPIPGSLPCAPQGAIGSSAASTSDAFARGREDPWATAAADPEVVASPPATAQPTSAPPTGTSCARPRLILQVGVATATVTVVPARHSLSLQTLPAMGTPVESLAMPSLTAASTTPAPAAATKPPAAPAAATNAAAAASWTDKAFKLSVPSSVPLTPALPSTVATQLQVHPAVMLCVADMVHQVCAGNAELD